MSLNLAEVRLEPSQDRASRAEAALDDLPGADRELARQLLGIIGSHYLVRPADREKIRSALRVMGFCSAALIAANAEHARAARDGFVGALDRSIRNILGL